MTEARQPREWLAAITSPTRGIMDMAPDAWSRSPADIERVRVREVMPGEPGGTITAAAGATDAASAIHAALTDLARELGCAYSGLIPHNAGLFIPGEALACRDPADAIRRLFAYVRAGGSVYRPDPPARTTPGKAVAKQDEPETDPRQVALPLY